MLPVTKLESLLTVAHRVSYEKAPSPGPIPGKVSLPNIHATSYLILLLLDSPGCALEVGFIGRPLCYDLGLIYWTLKKIHQNIRTRALG